ncbi:MAG: DUF4396 domain-containing protein [Candidatus Korobacteraceae bacterium]
MTEDWSSSFHLLSWLIVLAGISSSLFIVTDMRRRQPQAMSVMRAVWPINALWAGPFGIWAYWKIGRTGPLPPAAQKPISASQSASMKMDGMDKGPHAFWQKIVAGTFHCGAGCSLADLIGPILFRAAPFTVAASLVFGEWTLDYIIALLVGVTFQYAAISSMLQQTGARIWWRALKIDFLSLTAWQVGMYGWMALVIFVWFGPIPPTRIEFWFMMQLAMACGFFTSYPMNWWLVKAGIKTAM